MPFSLVQRLLLSLAAPHRAVVPRRAEVPPPVTRAPRAVWRWRAWLGSAFGRPDDPMHAPGRWPWLGHAADLEATREAFRDVVYDLDRLATAGALERVRLARSLQQLWHLRAEMFSLVARHRNQAEAEQRLAELDRHFSKGERPRWGRRVTAREGGASVPPA
jgi:hypothetical protein